MSLKGFLIGFILLTAAMMAHRSFGGPVQEERAEEEQREMAIQMGDLYLRSITLGVACGEFPAVLDYIEGYGELPRVMMTFDEGFSGFVSANADGSSGHLAVSNPAGETCLLLRASDLLDGDKVLYLIPPQAKTPEGDRM